MLLQSHGGEIHILPAIPKAWTSGHVKGLCARGGFVVDIKWVDGMLSELKILSKAGCNCKVRYNLRTAEIQTEKGKQYVFNRLLEQGIGKGH